MRMKRQRERVVQRSQEEGRQVYEQADRDSQQSGGEIWSSIVRSLWRRAHTHKGKRI